MRSFFICIFLLSQISNSISQTTDYIKLQGIVVNKWVFHKPGPFSDKPGFEYRNRIWYKDSFAIEEVVMLKTDINSKNEVTQKFLVEHFRFNDLRNNTIYLFGNFSDTSACFDKYSFAEADKKKVIGGWGFNLTRWIKHSSIYKNLSDTLVEGLKYKYMILEVKDKTNYFSLCLFRCDKSVYPFNFDIALSNKIKCPLTRVYDLDSTLKNKLLELDIAFTSDSLSSFEHKVFESWIRYARENPLILPKASEKKLFPRKRK